MIRSLPPRVIGHGASIAAQELVSTSTGSSNYPVVTAPAGVFHHEGVAAGYLSLIRTITPLLGMTDLVKLFLGETDIEKMRKGP